MRHEDIFPSLEEVKGRLGIPLENTDQDEFLDQNRVAYVPAVEEWIGRPSSQRNLIEFRGDPSEWCQALNSVDVITQGIMSIGRFVLFLLGPEGRQREEHYLHGVLDQAEEVWRKNPSRCVIASREIARWTADGLHCCVKVHWILKPNTFDFRIDEKGIPWLGEFQRLSLRRQFRLVFAREGKPSLPRADIIVRIGGEKNRLWLPDRAKRLLAPFVHRRLYLHTNVAETRGQVLAAIENMCIVVALCLVKEKLCSIDDDVNFRRALLTYLGKFRGAKEVGEMWLLERILSSYRLSEDYRALKLYVTNTIKGLKTEIKRADIPYVVFNQATGATRQMIPRVAELVGVSRRTLYRQAKEGKVRAEKICVGTEQYLTMPDAEIARLEQDQLTKRLRRALITACASKRNITERSARRWIERQEVKGSSLAEIRTLVGDKWLKRALRTQAQDTKAGTIGSKGRKDE